jgi:serine/threonine protein kinase
LDLKPSNILVYNVDTADEVWKITDFGLSRVRVKANSPTDGDSTMTIGVEGTYLAPECAVPGGKVSALSDVWSFGCIFSLVLTFMMDGRDGIQEFSRQRGAQRSGDCFYTTATMPEVSPAVTTWFGHLKVLAARGICPKVMCMSLDFLLGNVLLPRRKERLAASKIEADLKKIWTSYSQIEPPPTPELPAGRRPRWPFRATHISRPTPPAEFRSYARGSRFSPGVKILVSFTPTLNWILDLSDMSWNVVIQIPRSVNCLSVSDHYICNGLDGNCFKVGLLLCDPQLHR